MSGLAAEAESGPSLAASPEVKGNGKRRAREDTGQLSFEDLLWALPETPSIVEPASMPVAAGEHPPISRNYRITDKDRLGKGNQKAKFRDNVRAIELLRMLEAEGQNATPEEQSVLVKYTGWGGMPQAFDYANRSWEEEYGELEKLLTEEEYDSARASTLNAHYTSPDVIRFMYAVLGRIGFKEGRVLEPSLGIGYFLCLMPDEMLLNSRLSGIELDSLSGRIAKQLCPDADIRVMGFETARFPVNFFDLAVSNVPFGDYKLHDPLYRKHKFSIHEYFFAKSLDLVRPGGIVAFITSRYLMDRTDPSVRKYIYERADLLGAVRLPCSAFKEIANTEVTSDIVFLRKRGEGGIPGDGDWLEAVPCEVGDSEDAHINEYFVKNPHMLLGKLAWECGMYGRYDLSLKPDGRVLTEALNGALHLFPQDIFETETELPLSAVGRAIPSPDSVKEGAFVVHEGRLYRSIAGTLELQELPATTAKRVEKMVRLRDTARQLLHDEMTTADDAGIDFVRIQLNSIYDRFVKEFGYIHSRANRSAFSEDPDYPLLLSLELYDEESKKAEKAEVFSRRVIHPVRKVERVETVKEAFLVTLNELGRVDFDRMSLLTGKSEPDIRDELEGLIFRNPEGGWEPADQYLSGNVRKKLEIAELAAATDGEFRKNYEALKAVQPKEIDFAEIRANLGASWIPVNDVAVFINELVDVKDACDVAYSPVIGTWSVEISAYKRWEVSDSVNNTTKWGTARCNAVTLIRDALNNRMSTVRDYEDDKPIINEKETEAAREKQLLVREHFKEWLWKDPERRGRLASVYNATFNCLRARTFDGSHLNLPGMSTHLTLMKHQKDAIWRIIQTGTTLIDHIVGAGKAQPLDAKVLTPEGWRFMGDIKIGDQVISGQGTATVVKGVFPQGEKDIYRVMFSDGASTECCDEHLWLTQTYLERGYSQNALRKGKNWACAKPKVRQLSEIRATLLAPHLDVKNHSIPLVQAVQFPRREVPIAPYLMGALLGDGCFTGAGVTIITGDDEIVDECAKLLPDNMKVSRISSAKRCPAWSLINKKRSRSTANSIKNELQKLNLWGLSSSEKFIPESYLFNDIESRIELLQGLMDTDGCVNNRGTSSYFYTTSIHLAEGLKAIVQSLGGMVRTRLKRPTFMHKGELRKGKVCFVLCIAMPAHINPFKLSRKAASVVPKTKYAPVRYITDVIYVGRKEAQCILVEDVSHLYVTDEFIVTHNSFVMIAAAMEMRRLGLISKTMITVPNHLLEQWGAMFLRLYPMANVLISGHDDFTPARRKAFLGKIALNHWDAVIIAHSSFEKIPLSAAVIASHMEGRIRELEEAILSMREDNSGSRIVKELEKAKKRLAEKLQERLNEAAKDDGLTFEEIGVDMLFVDEADLFKNLFIVTKMSRIAGLPNADSKRAFDLSMKSQWLLRRRKPVVFATGTPVSNTIAEMYTMQRYQQPEMLVEHNISHFDSWAATFGEVVTSLEIAPDGSGYRMRSRFARFVNVPELLQMYWQVADVQTDATLQLEKPKFAGGKPIVVVAPASDVQKMYIKSLIKRAEALRAEHIDPRLDNMLKITTDGRKAALDMRLVDTLADDFEISKVNACVQKIYEEWIDMEELKGTQLVFCDLSTPRGDGFSVYEDIREKLVGKGIPREEIAFIHEADTDQKKKTLFVRVNFGRVRVLIGSTEKMGAGTNVQRLLGAEHHLDVPWRPRDVEQREGRILRQGNTHKTVRVYRYVTEGSFDSYIWQAVEAKGRFIAQLRSNQVSSRVVEDVEGVVLSYAEVKALASGNPLVMEKFKIDLEVQRLETLRSQHSSERYRLEYEVSALPARIENYKQAIEKRKHDLGVRRMPDPFRMEIDGTLYTERKYAGDKIIGLANLNKGTDSYEKVGSYAGFDLYIRTHVNGFVQPLVIARGLAEHKGNVSDSDVGTVNSLDFALRGIETSIAKYSSELAEMEKRLTGLTVELEKPFPHEERLRELLKKQYEINKELDIDKRDSADSAEEVAVIREKAA